MDNEAIIIGYSGHAYVLIDILQLNKYKIIGYCDNEVKTRNPYNLSYLGSENDEEILKLLKESKAFIAIGNNYIRESIFARLIKEGINCPSIIHSRSIISPSVKIGFGSVIMPGVVINSQAEIGNAVICNSSSIIEHECLIGDYAHIAPGAVLAGNVTVGNNTFIGANSVIKQGVKIGSNVTVGAGAVVLQNVENGLTVYGNPARPKTTINGKS